MEVVGFRNPQGGSSVQWNYCLARETILYLCQGQSDRNDTDESDVTSFAMAVALSYTRGDDIAHILHEAGAVTGQTTLLTEVLHVARGCRDRRLIREIQTSYNPQRKQCLTRATLLEMSVFMMVRPITRLAVARNLMREIVSRMPGQRLHM